MSTYTPALDEAQSVKEQSGFYHRVLAILRQGLREPLVHFLLIGLALFAIYYARNPQPGQDSSKRIELSMDDLRQLDIAFVSQWHRQPTPEEFAGLVEGDVRLEILYREGLALGLDKDDMIVKRRMAQKMEFLAEDVSAAHEPTTEELRAWFEKNSNRFTLPDRATFRHLYFSFDRRGQNAREEAARALAKLVGKPEDSPAAAALADPFMFQDYYGDRSPEQLSEASLGDPEKSTFAAVADTALESRHCRTVKSDSQGLRQGPCRGTDLESSGSIETCT
jgi:peptidyl-prolyl cis-trans isomerase C